MKCKILVLFAIWLPLLCAAQLPYTRTLRANDYRGYNVHMLHKLCGHMYALALEGAIKGYKNADLKGVYDMKQIRERGFNCEKVRANDINDPTRDTVICLPFDPTGASLWLSIDRSIIQKPDFRKQVAFGIGHDSIQPEHLLFYVAYPDFMDKLTADETGFLTAYLEDIQVSLKDTLPVYADTAAMGVFAAKTFRDTRIALVNGADNRNFQAYTNDSLTTAYTKESFGKKRDWFKSYDQNLDSDATISIILAETLQKTADGHTIKCTGIGIAADTHINTLWLPNVPVFFANYMDIRTYFSRQDSPGRNTALDFINAVSEWQMEKRLSGAMER